MLHKSNLILFAASALVISAWAQSAPQPLNLTLPPDSVPSQSAIAAPASSAKATNAVAGLAPVTASGQSPLANAMLPDMQYDRNENRAVDAADSANQPLYAEQSGKRACNDEEYAQPQVHGSVGMGIVAGDHLSGNYQTGAVQVTKALGSCDHPSGGMTFSIDVGRGSFGGSRGWH